MTLHCMQVDRHCKTDSMQPVLALQQLKAARRWPIMNETVQLHKQIAACTGAIKGWLHHD